VIAMLAMAAVSTAVFADGVDAPRPNPHPYPLWVGMRVLHADGQMSMAVVKVVVDISMHDYRGLVRRAGRHYSRVEESILAERSLAEIFEVATSNALGFKPGEVALDGLTLDEVTVLLESKNFDLSAALDDTYIQPLFVLSGDGIEPIYITPIPTAEGEADIDAAVYLDNPVVRDSTLEIMVGDIDEVLVTAFYFDRGTPGIVSAINSHTFSHDPESMPIDAPGMVETIRKAAWQQKYSSKGERRGKPFALFVQVNSKKSKPKSRRDWAKPSAIMTARAMLPLRVEVLR